MRASWLVAAAFLAYASSLPVDYFYGDQEPIEEGEENNAIFGRELIGVFNPTKEIGEVSGLAMSKEGHIVAFHRSGRVWDEQSFNQDETFNKDLGVINNKTIAIIDREKNTVDEFGEGLFYMPHGLTIDHNGDYWVTDVGSHQVHKIDAKTKKIVMSLGEKLVPGEDEHHFCKPTDVAVAKNGHIFVADGYCNSRILKFDSKGNLMAQINAAVEDNQSSEFIVPHSLALIEDMNIVCVADRENQRVQCFSAGLSEGDRTLPTGIPITSAIDIGRVFAIRERNHYLIGVTGKSEDVEAQMFSIDMKTGKTETFAKGVRNCHALAVAEDGTMYVSQLDPQRILEVRLF
uniref:peptidylamidoglycolate lyase n=1 Tax=Caenorhabditis tropicalis TaxID=1561998 RepID=A0A1I7UMZ0_9PELO